MDPKGGDAHMISWLAAAFDFAASALATITQEW